MLTLIADTITVVADPRLNRLIAQGTTDDIELIEHYLEIVDKDRGITSVETYGTSHVIELAYTDANEVAQTIREAYAGRVAASNGASNAPGGEQAGRQPSEGDARQRREDGEDDRRREEAPRAGRSGSPASLEPVMTVAVHEPSNSLIVTAPDQLFEEVQKLVEAIDQRSQQTVEFVSPGNTALLQAMLGQDSQSSSGRSSQPRSSSRSGSRSSNAERLRSMMRERYGR
jgi:type II secretory pathway component GspD/PulD (secretin)